MSDSRFAIRRKRPSARVSSKCLCAIRRELVETMNHELSPSMLCDMPRRPAQEDFTYIEEIGHVFVIVALLLLVRNVDRYKVCILSHNRQLCSTTVFYM